MHPRVMLSIGEFARLGGISIRSLRHYDEIGLLRPATVSPDTGYRGYSAAQLAQLNRIMALKELGLSLAQVRQLLAGVTLDELRGMLILRRAQLEQELEQHTSQLLGVEADVFVFPQGQARPVLERRAVGSGVDFDAGASTWTTARDGVPAPGTKYVVEMQLVLFETDVPPANGWDPHVGNYKGIWSRTLRQAEE